MAFNPVQTFLEEAEELLAEIEQAALALSAEDAPAETVNRLFRAFHTVKGSGAMCGLDAVAGFSHHVENLLDRVREGEIAVSPALTELILKCSDHVKLLLEAARGGPAPSGDAGESLVGAIEAFASPAEPLRRLADAIEHRNPGVAERSGPEGSWKIRFHPHPQLLANGGNPVVLFRDLRTLGRCEIEAHTEEVPLLDDLDPDCCYLWWSITLHSACAENAIRDVFLFVEDGRLEIEAAACAKSAEPAGAPREGPAIHKALPREATVRVPAERLDRLVNLVGEFVMNQSCLAQAVAESGSTQFANPVQVLERLVAELRDNVLGIRMLPIGTLFGRFRRVVHDLSAELGKEADLETVGAETELDKSILDQLSEPLVHCLRNCLDHGIEPPEERRARGKPQRATIRLAATHTGPSVVISIADDGRGIDREAVRRKAVEKQLVAPDAVLSEQEIFSLILLPGFSTAREVTSVSGRGVGMDAVQRQIDVLRGSLSVESTEGRGTRISITLPLTLAIIDGLLVEISGQRFILPLDAVTENVELIQAERARNNGRNLLAVRGELIPYIDLRRLFQMEGEAPAIEKVVIVEQAADRVGLVVDRVVGTHQTVIQSLGRFYRQVAVASGATIMGDGRVALILDLAALVREADQFREE